MNLEHGKRYVTAGGKVVGPMTGIGRIFWEVGHDRGSDPEWFPNGDPTVYGMSEGCVRIVREYTDHVKPTPVIEDVTITQHGFTCTFRTVDGEPDQPMARIQKVSS